MRRMITRVLGVVAAVTLCASAAHASTIPIAFISWDITIPGSTGAFDIVNLSGPNELPPDFPVTTPETLSSLSLTVDFTGGGTAVFGPAYFTLAGDGLSFNGLDIPIGGANPKPTGATLTGVFSTLAISLDGGGTATILAPFTATIPFAAVGLADGDFALIEATTDDGTGSEVPEPASLLLLGSGVLTVANRLRRRSQ